MIINIIFLVLSVILSAAFIFLLITSSKYDEYIEPLDSKEFVLCDIYGVGFKLLELINFKYQTSFSNKTRDDVTVLYGERYSEFYLQVFYAQKITLSSLCLAASFVLASLASGTDKFALLGLGIVVSGVVYFYYTNLPSKMIKKRSETFMIEFPNAVSTIALLVNSGMILREAWKEVSMSSDHLLYFEMRKVNEDIENGISEIDALYAFADRCVTPEIKKFTSFVTQGLEKGNKDLAIALRNQTNELWEFKKQDTLKRGELASSKLLIPLLIMFVGILIMIMGPIMTNLGI